MHRWAPVRLVRSTASQSSGFIRTARPSRVMAALFTRMSSLPKRSSVCLKPAFTRSASATSMDTARASPPAAAIFATTAANFSTLRAAAATLAPALAKARDRKSTRLNSSHGYISYAVFCLKKKKNKTRVRADAQELRITTPHTLAETLLTRPRCHTYSYHSAANLTTPPEPQHGAHGATNTS